MVTAVGIVLPVFALLLAGGVAGRMRLFPDDAVAVLNGFVVRLALPVLLFQFVAEADWPHLRQPGFAVAMAGGIAATFAATLLIASPKQMAADRTIEALASAYGNTAFMGIPIGQALFGAAGLAAAGIASVLTVCLLFAFAILLVEIEVHRGAAPRDRMQAVLGSLVRNPIMMAPLAGALWALSGWALPDPVHRFCLLLGGAASPVALVTIGLFLAQPRESDLAMEATARSVARLVALKLIGQPLATILLVRLLQVPAPWGSLAVLIAALPTGTGPFMLARLYDREGAVIARVILVTTSLSALTLPLLVLLLR